MPISASNQRSLLKKEGGGGGNRDRGERERETEAEERGEEEINVPTVA